MKILIISSSFPPVLGGVERVVRNLSENLSSDNIVKVIVSSGFKNKSLINKLNFLKIEKERLYKKIYVKRIWLNVPRSLLGIIAFPIRYVVSLICLLIYVTRFKPDIINYHFPDDSMIYMFILFLLTRRPIVLNIHGNDIQVYGKKLFYQSIFHYILHRSNKIVVNSSYMKKEVLNRCNMVEKKICIIPNGIDLEYIYRVNAKRFSRRNYLFYVGRMVDKKGVDILLKAFNLIKHKNIKLLLEGKGEKLDAYINLRNRLNLEDYVIFTKGKLSDEEKISYLKSSIVGVMPSRIEPFGIVALEIMACGVPVIASKTGGLKDIIEDRKNGLFFENGNYMDLKNKIVEVIENDDLRKKLIRNGNDYVKYYSWDYISKLYEKLFIKVTKS